jgi:hypothetical protein
MAAADPQTGVNGFLANEIADPNPANWSSTATVFGRLTAARANADKFGTTPLPVAAPWMTGAANTVVPQYDPTSGSYKLLPVQIPGPFDTPIRSFGTDVYANPAQKVNVTPTRTVNVGGSEIGVFSTPKGSPLPQDAYLSHPYVQQELLRKLRNNTTTTTDTFVVYVTVGFFEVTGSASVNTAPKLGKELFKDMPGDLRQRYMAVVDRSNLSIDPTSPSTLNIKQGGKPFITELVAFDPTANTMQFRAHGLNNNTITLNYEGTQFGIAPNTPLRIGTGSGIGTGYAAEWVNVTSIVGYNPATGIATVGISRNATPGPLFPAPATPPVATHYPGEMITNVVPGNPGPQTGFTPTAPNYQSVVPFFARVD